MGLKISIALQEGGYGLRVKIIAMEQDMELDIFQVCMRHPHGLEEENAFSRLDKLSVMSLDIMKKVPLELG